MLSLTYNFASVDYYNLGEMELGPKVYLQSRFSTMDSVAPTVHHIPKIFRQQKSNGILILIAVTLAHLMRTKKPFPNALL